MMTAPRAHSSRLLACPTCKGPLAEEPNALACRGCGVRYPLVDGIPQFASSNEFYDVYADQHCPYARSPQDWKAWILRVLPLVFRSYFDDPDLDDIPGLGWPRRFARWTAGSPLVNAAYEVDMGMFHRTIEQLVGRRSWAQFIHVSFDKSTG